MYDKNYNTIKTGNYVIFSLNKEFWGGEVIGVNEQSDRINIKANRGWCKGMVRSLNKLECSRYITVTD